MAKSTRKGWIDWRTSEAKAIILRDLEPGGALFKNRDAKAEEVFDFYKKTKPVQFADVVFSQFKERLADHIKQSNKERWMADRDAAAYDKDRRVHPRKEKNQRGELVYDVHPARELLRMDVAKGLHNEMKPRELQSTRPEYRCFKAKPFKHHIYQEESRQRFMNYLEKKREEKEREMAKQRQSEQRKKKKRGDNEKKPSSSI